PEHGFALALGGPRFEPGRDAVEPLRRGALALGAEVAPQLLLHRPEPLGRREVALQQTPLGPRQRAPADRPLPWFPGSLVEWLFLFYCCRCFVGALSVVCRW